MTDEVTPQGAVATPAQPVVPAAEVPVGNTEPQGGTDASAEPKQPSKGVQKRLDELTRNWRQTERDRDHWRELALKQSQPQQKPQAAQSEPTLEGSGGDMTKFVREHAAWAAREELRKAKEEEAQQKKQEKERERHQKYEERVNKTRTKYEDFDDLVTDPALPITPDMADYIRESDEGPEVAYWLAKNPQEAARIAQMNGRDADRALARIEARLSTPAPAPAAPKPVTNAPPPPPTVGTASAAAKPGLADDGSIKDWMKERTNQLRKRKEK
jgi:hypothetical protein